MKSSIVSQIISVYRDTDDEFGTVRVDLDSLFPEPAKNRKARDMEFEITRGPDPDILLKDADDYHPDDVAIATKVVYLYASKP